MVLPTAGQGSEGGYGADYDGGGFGSEEPGANDAQENDPRRGDVLVVEI